MNTTQRKIIIGSKSLSDFEKQIGQIPENQKELADKLKDMIFFCLLTFEKNSINEMVSVAFSSDGNHLSSVQNAMLHQFDRLVVMPGSIISCNFQVNLANLKDIFEKVSGVEIAGLICPEIDEQSAGFLRNHNQNCFIFADRVLSHRRSEDGAIFSNSEVGKREIIQQNDNIVPKLFKMEGITFPQLAVEKAKEFFF